MTTATPYRQEKHRADALRIHPLAQRSGLVNAQLRKIMDNFDLDAIGTVYAVAATVAGVTGVWIIDGWHRIEALRQLGFGEWEVDVHVYETEDIARHHALFLHHNARAGVRPVDKFANKLGAGDLAALGIASIVRQAGYQITSSTTETQIACVSSLERVFERDYGRSLRKTIESTKAAWGNNPAGHEGRIIEGIGAVFAKNNGAIDENALIAKLAKYSGGPAMLLGAARARKDARQASSVSKAIGQIVAEEYNKGRRTHRIEAP